MTGEPIFLSEMLRVRSWTIVVFSHRWPIQDAFAYLATAMDVNQATFTFYLNTPRNPKMSLHLLLSTLFAQCSRV